VTAPLLEVSNLRVEFPTDIGVVRAVNDVSFSVDRGEVLAVVGESGSGKSVSAMALMRLLPKTARVFGTATFAGRDLLTISERQMRKVRGDDISMIFQDPMTALNPVFKVGAQIAEIIEVHRDTSHKAALARSVELLELVGIPEPRRRADQFPHEYSGGMRQRAMIAMAIANEPKLLIADEPSTALDVTIQAQVMEAIREAQRLIGAAMLLITHDLGLVAGLADRIQVMYGGRVFETSDTDTVFYQNRNPYTRGLLESLPRLDARTQKKLYTIPGSPPNLLSLPRGCAFRPRCAFADEVCFEEPDLEPVSPGHLTRCHHANELPPLDDRQEVAS
jgi:oligopeptide/dipeptide ABC transporter ATP-binding protein